MAGEVIVKKLSAKTGHKKRKIWITVIIIEVFVLIGESSYLVWDMLSDKNAQDGQEQVVNAGQPDENKENSGNKLQNVSTFGTQKYDKYIFVGDSRYVGMSKSVQRAENDVFICKNNMGFTFLKEHLSNIKSMCTKDSVVIIGLGVNDFKYSVQNYIDTINSLASEIEAKVCFMLVNPVDEKREAECGYRVENDGINNFNDIMKRSLNDKVTIIDTNSYLLKDGFNATDGLHYDDETYKKIYAYIKENI